MKYISGVTILLMLLLESCWAADKPVLLPVIDKAAFVQQRGRCYLVIQGHAPVQLKGGVLTFGVSYQNQVLMWRSCRPMAVQNGQCHFQVTFTQLARCRRHIMAGPYIIRAYFRMNRQPLKLRNDFRQLLQQYSIGPCQQTAYYGTETIYAREDEQLLSFYAERLVFLLFLWRWLFEQSEKAAAVPYATGNNPFAEASGPNVFPKVLNLAKWRNWLKNSWGRCLRQQTDLMVKHPNKYLALRYPELYRNMRIAFMMLNKYAVARNYNVLKRNGLSTKRCKQGLSERAVTMGLNAQLQKVKHLLDLQKTQEYCRRAIDVACRSLGYQEIPGFCYSFFPFMPKKVSEELKSDVPPNGKSSTTNK